MLDGLADKGRGLPALHYVEGGRSSRVWLPMTERAGDLFRRLCVDRHGPRERLLCEIEQLGNGQVEVTIRAQSVDPDEPLGSGVYRPGVGSVADATESALAMVAQVLGV